VKIIVGHSDIYNTVR